MMNSVYSEDFYNELNNWNIGAMLCPFLWGLGNKIEWTLIAIALVSLCNPLTALLVCVWFGMNGNRWAFESGSYKDAETFAVVQKRWLTGILALYFVLYLVFAGIYILA